MDKEMILDIDFPLWDDEESIENKENENKDSKESKENDEKEIVTEKDFMGLFEEESRTEENATDKKNDEVDKESKEDNKEESVESSKETESEEDDKEDDILKSLLTDLKDNKIITIDIDEKEEINSDKIIELVDAEVVKRVEDEFAAFSEELDPEAKAFLKFKREGGSTLEFLKLYLNQAELPVDTVDTVEKQETFLRYYLKTVEEMDYDEINEEIEIIKERDQLSKKATKAFNKISSEIEKEKTEFLKQQEEAKIAEEESKNNFIKSLVDNIKEKDSLGDFSVSEKEKKEIIDFIIRPTEKIGNRKVTGMQAKINEVYRNPDKLLILAKLMINDFDISDLVKKVETKVTKKALDTVTSKRRTGNPKTNTKGQFLADIFK
jgi:hypothetical protein